MSMRDLLNAKQLAEIDRATWPYAGTDLRLVAWHQGGAKTLRTSARHILDLDSPGYLTTLCGRRFRLSRLVTPNDHWTDSDCQRCLRIAATRAVPA